METMTYGSKQLVTLTDLARIAEKLKLRYGYVRSLPWLQLNIWEDFDHFLLLWEGIPSKTILETDTSKQRFEVLSPKSTVLIHYHLSSIPLIIKTFTPMLIEFGGWIDCRGDYLKIFTLDNINEMKDFCP